jgi:hypothetical protein
MILPASVFASSHRNPKGHGIHDLSKTPLYLHPMMLTMDGEYQVKEPEAMRR